MISYFIQLLIFQALFLGVYELFLKKETFFSLNRAYLLVTPFLAAIIPLLEFGILKNIVPMEGIVQLPILILSGNNSTANLATALELTESGNGLWGYVVPSAVAGWLLVIYFFGAIVSFALFLRKYVQLQHLKYSGNPEKHEKITLVRIPKSRMACTFFNTIFLGEDLSETETSHIMAHELAHVEQKHSWDLLWFEFLRIVLWFDPLIYRCQSQLSVLHEYIADEKVTRNSDKSAYFQDLLNSTFGTRHISFTNQFFTQSFIKNRIIMLQKPKSNRNAKWKYLLILPMIFMMLTYVACSEPEPATEPVDLGVTFEIVDENRQFTTEELKGVYESYLKAMEGLKLSKSEKLAIRLTFDEYQELMKATKKTEFSSDDDASNVSFSAVEQVPVFPGCENVTDQEAQKACMSQKIREFVNANFDTGLAKELGLTGINRIQVMFKINKNGEVVDVKARAPHPALKKEAIRVVDMLPDMSPGKQDGKPVSVMYSLPIIFNVE